MEEIVHTQQTFTLNTGDKIPAIGCGTWHVKGEAAAEQVKNALLTGYRHIDTAYAYGNETQVGKGIRDSGIPRDQIWITTKLDHKWHHRVPEAIDASLKNLGVDYIDLYLMHWPCATNPENTSEQLPDWTFIKTWEEMQKLPETGKVRNIGVCNLQLKNLKKLLDDPTCKIIPAVNQIELHPNYPSNGLIKKCREHGIHVTAYSVLGSEKSPLLAGENPVVNKMAERKGKSIAQILLMWGLQRGTSVIPRSAKVERIKSNFALDEWSLSDAEMKTLNSVQERFKVIQGEILPTRVFFNDSEVYSEN